MQYVSAAYVVLKELPFFNPCVFDLQLEDAVQIFRNRIEPEATVTLDPPPPPVSDSTQMEEDGVGLASPIAPLPPLPETQKEGVHIEQQEEEKPHQDVHHEDCQEEHHQQPPPPSASEELLKPTEPPKDSKTGKHLLKHINIFSYIFWCNWQF